MSTAAACASSARSTGIATISYSCRISIVRSARPWLSARNSTVSPRSRA